jgi:cobalamin biosynthetic protein CobC
MLEHGGRLRAAAHTYSIPLASWLDLSTGISPWGYPLPAIPDAAWYRLPDPDDGLVSAAIRYYDNDRILATSGSQAAIQALPRLFSPRSVTIVGPTYNEHAAAWHAAGHAVSFVVDLDTAVAHAPPITLLCNPNNPTATRIDRDKLLAAAQRLLTTNGWLIVDEAYGDDIPALSVTPDAGTTHAPQLVTLRSLGKFFGLAGARVGFAFGDQTLLDQLNELLGPWSINGPARHVAEYALADTTWQSKQRNRIHAAGERLRVLLLSALPAAQIAATGLFSTCTLKNPTEATSLYEHLAKQGILTRLFANDGLVRIGIPDEDAWARLGDALHTWKE